MSNIHPNASKEIDEAFAELQKALSKNSGLKMYFEKLALSHRREYAEYIADAKQDETKERRIKKVVEMIAENKKLHEKYEKKNKYKR